AIWLMGSKRTLAPRFRAISAVASVELLSTTMISDSKSERALARKADERCCRQFPMLLASLKAGMITDSFMEHPLSFFACIGTERPSPDLRPPLPHLGERDGVTAIELSPAARRRRQAPNL